MTVPSDGPEPKPLWSNEARTAASLVLFAHLFALVVAITSYTRPSGLQQRLHDLFAPYLRNLHITPAPVSYPYARFHLTHALPTDVDYQCQVEFQEGGAQQVDTIPPADLWLPIRQRRYQALANAAGTLLQIENNEDVDTVLPKAIAGSILRRHDAKSGSILIRAHDVPLLEEMGNVESGRRAPLEMYRNVYEARVLVSPGTIDLLRKSETPDVAPVDRGRQGRTAPRNQSNPKSANERMP